MIYSIIKKAIFPLAILLFVGCQKEASQLNEISINEVTASKGESSSGCRMTLYDYYNSFDDYHSIDNISYKNGLVDEWTTFGWTYKMEYNKNKQLRISRAYDGATLLYTIHFIYKNNKVIKEIWYIANTTNIDNEIFITYNSKGDMLRNESFLFDFFVDYTYYSNGGLKSWQYYSGGMPVVKGEYIYNDVYKNPFLSTPGVEYNFFYTNSGFGAGTGKKWYSSEKITLFDENGDPSIDYEQDPKQTTWQVGQQNYPLNADYIDKWGEGLIRNTFEYENCNPGHSSRPADIQKSRIGKNDVSNKQFRGLLHGPSKYTIERLNNEKLMKISN